MSNLLPIIDKKPADITRLRNGKVAQSDPGHYIRGVNQTFNWLIDQLRAERLKNKRLRARIAVLFPKSKERVMSKVLDEIAAERQAQVAKAHGGDTEAFDKSNSRNDWIAYVAAYTGRAAGKCFRNEREGCDFRENMVKAAAICVAAIEAHDKGYC